jgi:hypothetical protein
MQLWWGGRVRFGRPAYELRSRGLPGVQAPPGWEHSGS